MLLKILAVLFVVISLFTLGRGLIFLVTDNSGSTRSSKTMTWQVIISIVLFTSLIIACYMHWAMPHHL